jgi:SHS2 domain-containing protein
MIPAGYREVAHTADWELQVWAPDMVGLLEQAGRGMYYLAGVRLEQIHGDVQPLERKLTLSFTDPENLLVRFLSELLYFSEQEGIAFSHFDLRLDGQQLAMRLEGARLAAINKEIKAVTYHNLAVRRTSRGLEAQIVFDV